MEVNSEHRMITRDHGGQDELIGPEELANRLKVPISFVYGKSRTGAVLGIKVLRVGKYIRFRDKDVRSFINGQS